MPNGECRMVNAEWWMPEPKLASAWVASIVVLLRVDFDGREDVDQLSRFVDERRRGVLQPGIGVDEEPEPETRLAGFLSGDRNLGAEIRFRLSRVRLFDIRPDRSSRAE